MKSKGTKWVTPLILLLLALASAALYGLLQDTGSPDVASKVGRPALQEPGMSTGKVLLALLFVISLIFLLGWVTRQVFMPQLLRQNRTGALSVVDSLAVSAKGKIILLRVSEKLLLFGVTEQTITFLSEIDDPTLLQKAKQNAPKSDTPSFLQYLQKSR